MKVKDVAIIAGVAYLAYKFAPKSVGGGGGGQGFSFDFSNLFGGWGEGMLGGISDDWGDWLQGLQDQVDALGEMVTNFDVTVPDMGDFVPPELPDFNWENMWNQIPEFDWLPYPQDLPDNLPAGVPDLMPDMPDWIPSIPEIPFMLTPTSIQTAAKQALMVYARQVGGTLLTGHGIAKYTPVIGKTIIRPASKLFQTVTRDFAPKLTQRLAPAVVDPILKAAGKQGIKVIGEEVATWETKQALKWAIPKVVGRAGVKVGTRAIPIIGWGLLAADVGADIVRLFGVDVTEWLGISPIIGAFTGENPIEKWAGAHTEAPEEMYNPSIDSETGRGWFKTGLSSALDRENVTEKPELTWSIDIDKLALEDNPIAKWLKQWKANKLREISQGFSGMRSESSYGTALTFRPFRLNFAQPSGVSKYDPVSKKIFGKEEMWQPIPELDLTGGAANIDTG